MQCSYKLHSHRFRSKHNRCHEYSPIPTLIISWIYILFGYLLGLSFPLAHISLRCIAPCIHSFSFPSSLETRRVFVRLTHPGNHLDYHVWEYLLYHLRSLPCAGLPHTQWGDFTSLPFTHQNICAKFVLVIAQLRLIHWRYDALPKCVVPSLRALR